MKLILLALALSCTTDANTDYTIIEATINGTEFRIYKADDNCELIINESGACFRVAAVSPEGDVSPFTANVCSGGCH